MTSGTSLPAFPTPSKLPRITLPVPNSFLSSMTAASVKTLPSWSVYSHQIYAKLRLTITQLTDWLAHVPKEVLAKNFQTDESAFSQIPGSELYIFPGRTSAIPLHRPSLYLTMCTFCRSTFVQRHRSCQPTRHGPNAVYIRVLESSASDSLWRVCQDCRHQVLQCFHCHFCRGGHSHAWCYAGTPRECLLCISLGCVCIETASIVAPDSG